MPKNSMFEFGLSSHEVPENMKEGYSEESDTNYILRNVSLSKVLGDV